MTLAPERPKRDMPIFIGEIFGTMVVGLVFCTLAWTIGQQML